MHRSRLAGIIIDCQTDNLSEAAQFWSQALGYASQPATPPDNDPYVILSTAPDDLYIEVQKVDHPSRVHIDIEADDIEAEVQRLERLGAKRLQQVKQWWVMEAPTGQRFCVVHPQRSDFAEAANQWHD